MSSIQILNRKSGKLENEVIYGESAMKWAYENPLGLFLTKNILTNSTISKIVGKYKNTSLSARSIEKFINKFQIPIQEYEEKKYNSFNDFFIRKFKPGMRPFSINKNEFCAFAEGRYVAYDKVDAATNFPVKGKYLNSLGLLGDDDKAKLFENGPMVIARLCPVDYHRFHYPDQGSTVERYSIHGPLHSVNPIALKKIPNILIKNERTISILKTENFGYLAYIEVGALCVGKIIQSQNELGRFRRGDEKGYFLFGGSTVILLGEPGSFTPDLDLIENTKKGIETLIQLGSKIGVKTNL